MLDISVAHHEKFKTKSNDLKLKIILQKFLDVSSNVVIKLENSSPVAKIFRLNFNFPLSNLDSH